MKKAYLISCIIVLFAACNSDDDICESGEASPRLKLRFKTEATGNVRSMDSIFVSVDYGNGRVAVINNRMSTDSVMIPLRVDENPFTEIYVSTDSLNAPIQSKIRFNYITNNEYVSPACGIKRTYSQVTADLENVTPVKSIEQNQTEIVNEDKTHFFLLF